MDDSSQHLKACANAIARCATYNDRLQVAQLLESRSRPEQPPTGSFGSLLAPRSHHGRVNGEPAILMEHYDQVGIWRRRKENGEECFFRCPEMATDWHLWADVERIPPKRKKRRVVLIGESAARGFLYDPMFTPAVALQTVLQTHCMANEVEVVDLARSNLGLEIEKLAKSALLLDPDAIVIFAGNNWGPLPGSFWAEKEDVARVVRENGLSGMKHLFEAHVALGVKALLKSIAGFYLTRAVPVVWVIPEFNLGDWREPIQNPPHLADHANKQWLEAADEARLAIRNRDFHRAASMARRMVELDQGLSVAGFYILADCRCQTGDWAGAREYLESARDAVIWDHSFTVSPRAYSVVQQALRLAAAEHGNTIVDLPAIFREYLHDEIPDRRLFLDYCHLNSTGIQIFVSATASALLEVFRGEKFCWGKFMEQATIPTAKVRAEADLLAAIHNAHWFQGYDLPRYFCVQSLRLWPEIASVMTDLIDRQTRRAPILMNKSAEHILKSGFPLIQHYLSHSVKKLLDKVLLDALADSLREVGLSAGKMINWLRREEHSLMSGSTNLLDHYYLWSGGQAQEVMWGLSEDEEGSQYYKAYNLESKFVFVGEKGCTASLRITCRLPNAGAPAKNISFLINGVFIGEATIGKKWETWDILATGDIVLDGLNGIAVVWPAPEFPGKQAMETVADDILKGKLPESYYVFGEIHSFVAINKTGGSSGVSRSSFTPCGLLSSPPLRRLSIRKRGAGNCRENLPRPLLD